MADERTNIFRRTEQFLKDVWQELKKVNWSTRAQLKQSTKVVLISTLLLAAFLGAIDVAASALLTWFLDLRF
jgi:preprotein translocase subunit SecE